VLDAADDKDQSLAVGEKGQSLTAELSDEGQAQVLEALQKVKLHKEIRGELPSDVWSTLEKFLPKKGLRQFLERFPQRFEILSREGDKLVWKRIA